MLPDIPRSSLIHITPEGVLWNNFKQMQMIASYFNVSKESLTESGFY